MTGPALPRNRRDPTRLTQEPPDPRQRFAQRALHFPDRITTAPHCPQQILLLDAEPDRTHTPPRLHASHHRLPAVMHRPAEIATTFETSQTDTHGIGSARSLRLKNSSQKKPSQYCDTALMRHTCRNECTEANFGARIRYSDNVSGPLPTSTVVLPNCVHRPVHQVGISMPS
jgi:hypothetical protein